MKKVFVDDTFFSNDHTSSVFLLTRLTAGDSMSELKLGRTYIT